MAEQALSITYTYIESRSGHWYAKVPFQGWMLSHIVGLSWMNSPASAILENLSQKNYALSTEGKNPTGDQNGCQKNKPKQRVEKNWWNLTLQNSNDENSEWIAHCRNVRGLGGVSYIDQIKNLNRLRNVTDWKATQPTLRVFSGK